MRNDFYDIRDLLLERFDKNLVDTVLNAKRYKRIYGVTGSPVSKRDKVDIDFCKFLYDGRKLPCYKIAMLYGISDGTMRTYLIDSGASMTGHRVGKNSENNYFEKIDTFDKAYFLGLIMADGSISLKNRNVQLSLTATDSYILEKFNEYANLNCKLFTSHANDAKPRKTICVNSIKMAQDLNVHGVKERKSYNGTLLPNTVPDDLVPHFIRGYFDGGGIAKKTGAIGFCGDSTLLRQIKGYLMFKIRVSDNVLTFNRGNNISYIQWSKREEIKDIFNLMYKDKQDLYLVRKYEKIRPFIQ